MRVTFWRGLHEKGKAESIVSSIENAKKITQPAEDSSKRTKASLTPPWLQSLYAITALVRRGKAEEVLEQELMEDGKAINKNKKSGNDGIDTKQQSPAFEGDNEHVATGPSKSEAKKQQIKLKKARAQRRKRAAQREERERSKEIGPAAESSDVTGRSEDIVAFTQHSDINLTLDPSSSSLSITIPPLDLQSEPSSSSSFQTPPQYPSTPVQSSSAAESRFAEVDEKCAGKLHHSHTRDPFIIPFLCNGDRSY